MANTDAPKKVHYNSFGPYRLSKTVGQGEFGKVKLAHHIQTGKEVTLTYLEVAIKLVKKEDIQKPGRTEKLIREIDILKLYEVLETERYVGIVTAYASGGELFKYMITQKHRQYLKEQEAAKYFAQLIVGVEYLLNLGIVHRDLKLENLLLDENKNIVIIDFGFANRFGQETKNMLNTNCGSLCYAAPELVINDSYVAGSVDIWSCGVILYAMLCGYLPYDDDPNASEDTQKLYKYILETKLTFPNHVSHGAKSLVNRILVPDPSLRANIDEIKTHTWIKLYYEKYKVAKKPIETVPEESEFKTEESTESAETLPKKEKVEDSDKPAAIPVMQEQTKREDFKFGPEKPKAARTEDSDLPIRAMSLDRGNFIPKSIQLLILANDFMSRSSTVSRATRNVVMYVPPGKETLDKIKLHSGPIDQRAISNLEPGIIMERVIKVFTEMGMDVVLTRNAYKMKIVQHTEKDFGDDSESDFESTVVSSMAPPVTSTIRASAKSNYSGKSKSAKIASALAEFPALILQNLMYMGKFGLQYNRGFDGKPIPPVPANREPVLKKLKFYVAIHRIKSLEGIYTVDCKRLKGDIWEFKHLYNDFIGRLQIELEKEKTGEKTDQKEE
ncbi:hypothetical protein HK103_000654 [Boothiomyces macroporosus]|uniref:Non-specific serine/threonine protein kinase n=1 Tax=Boothiomyces macroporosus TaxID=261099 RepID=A0AAD5UN56_9FUNG|nr:hypothetical protein HK103_000654 [Boothiomyces macroporosus]